MDLNEYIPIIIGGLYAITLISITIFSIVGNIIQQKTMGMYKKHNYLYLLWYQAM